MSEPVPTGCAAIDELLDGGFERGAVTQLYGPPASGKTNLALSAVVEIAAAGGVALYIDTEGLSAERFEQLARARVEAETDGTDRRGNDGVRATEDDDGEGVEDGEVGEDGEAGKDGEDGGAGEVEERGGQDENTVEALASRVIVTDALDFDDQAEAVRDAADLASQVDLVVLDSATGFYRLERTVQEEGEALRKVTRQVTHLLSLARKHDLAVVITNQVFADPESESDRVRPLGGHTLTHWSGVVVRLERFRGGNRRATLEKHRSKPAGATARFRITETGLESVEEGEY